MIASTATTTAGVIGANVVAGAAIGGGAVNANAAIDGRVPTVSEVVQGQAVGAVFSGVAGAVSELPRSATRAAVATMTPLERVATGNLIQGIDDATRSAGGNATFGPASQGIANGAATAINAATAVTDEPDPKDR